MERYKGSQSRQTTIPVDTGRKLNVHKTFRRRPGRLLNVLCTFNVRPVSTGMLGDSTYIDNHCSTGSNSKNDGKPVSKLQDYNYTEKREEEDISNKDTDKSYEESDDKIAIQLEDINLTCCAFFGC